MAVASPLRLRSLLSGPVDPGLAWLFPGQGSQHTGMGQDLHEASAAAREIFQWADATLDFPISQICFDGPDADLRQTINAQPAIFVVSLASLAAALESSVLAQAPAYIAGHSLGEYTALAAADAIDLTGALLLVRERGRLMHEAGQGQPGTMAALIGLDDDAVQEVCRQSGSEVANLNSSGQTVIGGPPANVERAGELARGKGGRSVPLGVSGAFHTSLMRPAADALGRIVDSRDLREPRLPVVANSSSELIASVDAVRDELKRQLVFPVLWRQSMERMLREGVSRFVEIGPGCALSTLIKRIDGNVTAYSLNSLEAIRSLSHV